ncbi:TMAO reductase system periplasmic protein TorT [Pseudomonas turukhanskensis]|uniref:TMAO reductase system periplasmic protein TorT n=1 Tax=Pseudomonas turukhanskensis TaxID=1806536 RepID=A0A9W6NDX0_9PSED|nr:TMAO reductase system periplasmic protein TorT [Pseudomonas turukhanskensis]GLK86996.1 TMAO reductase system periplasmic protein TorT [Pseudomonas turukhanskensis]
MRVTFPVVVTLCLCLPVQAQEWFPVPVMSDGQVLDYQPLSKAARPWRVCALLPQGLGRYWWAMSWGLSQEAQRQGVRLGVYDAGGYQNDAVQREQFAHCAERGADAYIVGGVSAQGLCPQIQAVAEHGAPVIDLANRLDCPGVRAHARVDFAEMTKQVVAYLLADSKGRAVRVGWFPGPEGAAWLKDAEDGLREAIAGKSVTLIHGGYGVADISGQAPLVRDLLAREPNLDYVLGNAEAAAFASRLRHNSAPRYHFKVLSFYANERLLEPIAEGQVLAAPTDSPVVQARIAVDLAVRMLEKQQVPRMISPQIIMLDRSTVRQLDLGVLMAPSGQWMIRQDLPD